MSICRSGFAPVLFALILPVHAAQAQEEVVKSPGVAAYISKQPLPLQIDGHLHEEAWSKAPPNTQFHQFQPEDGLLAPDGYRTTVQVVVDENALVFGIRAWHAAPAAMNGSLARRDKVARDQDYIGIWIDPTGHGRSAQFARINVSGVLSDGMYRSDDDEEDLGPDFPVESAVQILPDGYSMEIRWPISSLRFPHGEAKPWKLMVERSVPHADGMLLLSAPLRKGALSFIEKMDELTDMETVLPLVQDKKYWDFRPEITSRQRSGQGEKTRRTSLGVDISARPRADWVFNATLNPDFSQVEIDEPTSTGTNRIALSLPEKRAFFLESADVLGMRLPGFYSRTIADPRWGARATWRGATADATAMSLSDRAGGIVMRGQAYETSEHVNSTNSTATLLRARSHKDNAVNGIFLSKRDYGDGGANTVVGADGQWRSPASDEGHMQAAWALMASRNTAQFDGDKVSQSGDARNGGYAWTKLDYRSDTWGNMLQLEAIGAGFVNDNGFVPQTGIFKTQIDINRKTGPQRVELGTVFEAHETELHLGVQEHRTLADPRHHVASGEVVQRWIRPGIWFYSARQTRFWADLGIDQQRGRTGAALHRTPALHFGFESSPLPWLVRLASEVTLGRQLDVEADQVGQGGNVLVEMGLRFSLPAGWSLESDHRWNRAWVNHATRQDFVDYGWRWVGTLHMSPRDSVRMIVQNTGTERYPGVPALLEPWSDDQRHRSLLYRHVQRHGRSISLGATTDTNGALPGASKGITAKLQWEI